MKQKLVSGLGILLVLPAFAGARLPAVNMSAGAVSARSQYGIPVQNTPVVQKKSEPVVSGASTTRTAQKRVVARSAANTTAQKKSGEKIASADYLKPNRPSSDLWANNDTPLRMPRADEFSVVASNVTLPEEKISAPKIAQNDARELSTKVSSLDEQIARLMDMQRRAEESARSAARTTSRPESAVILVPTVQHKFKMFVKI